MAPTTVVMPKMGYDMTQGKIVRWLKHEGDRVEKGEPIAEIETEKVNIEIEAFTSGVLQRIIAQEGQTVPVGQPIATIVAPGEKPEEAPLPEILPTQAEGAGEGAEAPPTHVEARAPAPEAPTGKVSAPAEAGEERVKASPVARRFAEEQGVELSLLQGTGPGGRITKEDVERFLAEAEQRRRAAERAAPSAPPTERPGGPAPAAAVPEAGPPGVAPVVPLEGVPYQTKELSKMGQAIARHMSDSKRTVPHFYTTVEIDMSEVASIREELNRTLPEEERISFNDFVMKAVAAALAQFPALNASFSNGNLLLYQEINLAMAVALDEGLITPVIKQCDRKSLLQIARESKQLAARAREGKLRQEEYEGGTFTVSNMGMLGVDEFAAIINLPQTAILAVGAVKPRPIARNGSLAAAQTMKATLSADHRATNGAEAARFLSEVKRLLENPVRLILRET